MKTLTPEQEKKLGRLGFKFLGTQLLNGVHHALMLILINFILVMAVSVTELPEQVLYLGTILSALFIFRRMFSINKENYDRFIKEIKKITEK